MYLKNKILALLNLTKKKNTYVTHCTHITHIFRSKLYPQLCDVVTNIKCICTFLWLDQLK